MAHHQKNMYINNNKGVRSFKHPQQEGGYKNSYNTGHNSHHNKLNETSPYLHSEWFAKKDESRNYFEQLYFDLLNL